MISSKLEETQVTDNGTDTTSAPWLVSQVPEQRDGAKFSHWPVDSQRFEGKG